MYFFIKIKVKSGSLPFLSIVLQLLFGVIESEIQCQVMLPVLLKLVKKESSSHYKDHNVIYYELVIKSALKIMHWHFLRLHYLHTPQVQNIFC